MLRHLAWQTFANVSKEFINLRLPSEAATEKYFHFAIVLTLVSKWDKQHDTPMANYCVHVMPIEFIQSQMNTLKPLILHFYRAYINPLKPELSPICYLLALLGAHHFLHVSRIRVKLLTLR